MLNLPSVSKECTMSFTLPALNAVTSEYTDFPSFDALLNAQGGYFPSFNIGDKALLQLANAYDFAQACRNDSRRVNRYSKVGRATLNLQEKYQYNIQQVSVRSFIPDANFLYPYCGAIAFHSEATDFSDIDTAEKETNYIFFPPTKLGYRVAMRAFKTVGFFTPPVPIF
ncbi:hypothetical protein [Beggiatoa leptomitoformis]|uniref:Uncharacterized protein n=1 Tax=Beggiatoa leptomitoformis TaxID=288004 RepID=A0A2N9YH27_9GAMM|nr:hypothetical protein [Beggiatoa leptomitoformis]ALG67902.1 hypothetical protein AL038_09495 [Beggiatoa leptomitoformis]AUI69832.1 hypothetical protein BLE401_14785 [Beggiatoa leptomitoformis]